MRLIFACIPTFAFAQPQLAQPLDCTLGQTCFIQQFADQDRGPDAIDFRCGPQTYDGHSGTDFALPDLAAQAAGVAVLAAAPGVVTGIRDSLPDILQGQPDAPDITGVECGNGLVIDHGDGWETQYCHMALGSVVVRPGQRVETGTLLGHVGLSGDSQFPHLHLAVRHNGLDIDPFDPNDDASCRPDPAQSLWSDPPPTPAGGIIALGFADAVPEFDAIKAGTADIPLRTTSAAMVVWGHIFGARAGDQITLKIEGPNGEITHEVETLTRTQARLFRAAGRRTPPAGWPAGDYIGTVVHTREGAVLDQKQHSFTLSAP